MPFKKQHLSFSLPWQLSLPWLAAAGPVFVKLPKIAGAAIAHSFIRLRRDLSIPEGGLGFDIFTSPILLLPPSARSEIISIGSPARVPVIQARFERMKLIIPDRVGQP